LMSLARTWRSTWGICSWHYHSRERRPVHAGGLYGKGVGV